ncbi:MAG TPA: AraC family transcriptional regulator [Gemmatimonadaceae bacterium]|nr:AraC family transcriptional regulator [Gemmatimonadaceae bacterium]
MTSNAPYVGNFVPWDGGSMLIGRGGSVVPVHAHYAIQIAFGSIPGIRFRGSESEEWTSYPGAIIPSRQPHSMDVTQVQPCAVLLIEPETRQGRAIAERWLADGIATIPCEVVAEHGAPIFAAWREERSIEAIERAARRLVHVLTGGVDPSTVSDERILRAVAHIRDHIDQPMTLEEVANVACLSPSRFRHLFVEQTGMAFRPYVLWRRFLKVWELLAKGTSLSAAAHAAGFADAAHLSRTSKQMFGFPPSLMQVTAPLKEDEARVH